jgi:hypothetical protein
LKHLYRPPDVYRALCGRFAKVGDTLIPSVHPDRTESDCIECRAAVGLTLSREDPQPKVDEKKFRIGPN